MLICRTERNGRHFISPLFIAVVYEFASSYYLLGQSLRSRTMLRLIVLKDVDPAWVRSLFDSMSTDPRPLLSIQDHSGGTSLHNVWCVALAKCLIEYSFDPETSGVQSTWMCPSIFSIRNIKGETPHDVVTRKGKEDSLLGNHRQNYKAVKKVPDSFKSLPLIDAATMTFTTELNQFQRFLARRIYYTTLCKLPPGHSQKPQIELQSRQESPRFLRVVATD